MPVLKDDSQEALKRAVKQLGGQAKFARALSEHTGRKLAQQNVWNWLNRDVRIPGEWCVAVEELTKRAVHRFELRPDIFPVPARRIHREAAE